MTDMGTRGCAPHITTALEVPDYSADSAALESYGLPGCPLGDLL